MAIPIKSDKYSCVLESLSNGSWLDVAMPGDSFPAGWTLIQGVLIRRGGDYDARLYYDLVEESAEDRYFEIPASSKGVINELICLPAGIKRIRFSPMGSAGEFELTDFFLTRIGTVERIWRMARRVVTMLFLHSRQKRKLIRLNLFQMLVDLQGSYKIASRLRAHAAAPSYQNWAKQFDELTAADLAKIGNHISRLKNPPHFHLLIMADEANSDHVQKTLCSLEAQVYRDFTCILLDSGGKNDDFVTKMPSLAQGVIHVAQPDRATWLKQFNASLVEHNAKEWVLLIRAGDSLAPQALYRFACCVLANPEAAVVYSDDDMLDANGQRCNPRFKPDWSLTHFRSTNFVGDAVALRCDAVAAAGGVGLDCFQNGNYGLLLHLIDTLDDEGACSVAHIPAVLLHHWDAPHTNLPPYKEGWRTQGDSEEGVADIEALKAHLARNGAINKVSKILPGCWQVRYLLPDVPPMVSIIVPTRDEFMILRQCVDSLLAKTTYPRLEILIVDNQSVDAEAIGYLARIDGQNGVRVLHYDQPFNFSAINNFAVNSAQGEVICLLNNDTEVISPDWLEEMVGHLLQPKVGAVGAKLYFQSGRVQHGGDLVGVGGVANHAHAFLQHDDPGYCNQAVVAQELSAVTGACMITWKSLYKELHGLDEKHLPVAFNDVDYCLRVREAGYRVVWTPHAELYHHESVSRGKDKSPENIRRAKREVNYMRKRWKRVMQRDPFYNPNLSYERPDFSLSKAPMVERPWNI